MATPPFDLPQAQRWLAIETNNLAWSIIENSARTPEEVERLVHLAHASCWHWSQIGQPLNELRGLVLLTTAYGIAQRPEAARHYARRCLALGRKLADGQTPFDRATTLASAAMALRLAGDDTEAGQLHAEALMAAAALESDDRSVFDQLYG